MHPVIVQLLYNATLSVLGHVSECVHIVCVQVCSTSYVFHPHGFTFGVSCVKKRRKNGGRWLLSAGPSLSGVFFSFFFCPPLFLFCLGGWPQLASHQIRVVPEGAPMQLAYSTVQWKFWWRGLGQCDGVVFYRVLKNTKYIYMHS